MLQWINQFKQNQRKATVMVIFLSAVVFCFLILTASPALAQSVASPDSELQQGVKIIEAPLGLPSTDIRLIIARVIRVALGLVGIVMVVMIIFSGYLWMTAGGNDEQIGRAKKIIINAVIGLAIILSAYAIVFFVMRMLGVGGLDGSGSPSAVDEGTTNFRGSGALGRVIRDHYPTRDQQGVPRNTKIAITFAKPLQVSSFTVDKNNNSIFGDCVAPAGNPLNIEADCDNVKLGDDFISISKVTVGADGIVVKTPIRGAALFASYVTENAVNRAYTIVVQPYDYLGSDAEFVQYLVHLGSGIKLDLPGNPVAFDARVGGNNYYEWQFVCSKELDLTPPRVVDVYPAVGSNVPKNTAIQITFDKAIDPTGAQGRFNLGSETYFLDAGGADNDIKELNSYIYLKSAQSSIPVGKLSLVNNYRTLEFVSETECGVNACGGKIYCLPVCDVPPADGGANCQRDNYKLLLKAAQSIDPVNNKFQSIPFSGIADLSSNALDGGEVGVVEVAPRDRPIFGRQEVPDNFGWNFNVTSDIDLTAPFIRQVQPGLDASNVPPNRDWTMDFSKRMLIDSIYSIDLAEYPTPDERCVGHANCDAVPLWKVPSAKSTVDNTTLVKMSHGSFLNKIRMYYFPAITSDVVDVNYNCMYPGRGPGTSLQRESQLDQSLVCDASHQANCCAVAETNPSESQAAAWCCNGVPNPNTATVDQCVAYWKGFSPVP
ncbi:MAG: hypothetical protein Q7S66_01390 [bacterium]|nr:hypothetical protein [bacterium]